MGADSDRKPSGIRNRQNSVTPPEPYKEQASPVNPTHHINRSQHYLNYASADLAASDCTRAARALYRAATHAVTAAAVHWHHPHYSKRRLGLVVTGLVRDGRLRCAHWRTFREIRDLPGRIAAAPNAARPMLRRVRRRVDRLFAAVSAAIAGCPARRPWRKS